jgi:hypothetical protein
MAAPSSLSRLSRLMAWLSTAGFVIVPAITIYAFLAPERSRWLMLDFDHLGAALNSAVPIPFRLVALICELFAVSFTMWALWSLRRLFFLYAKGEVFTPTALRSLNHVAMALLGGVIANFVMQAPISLVLTWYLGHGHRAISLAFGSGDISTLFTVGVVMVVARVMTEAQRVADENAKFV